MLQNKQQFFYFSLYGSSYELSIILIKLFTRGKNNLPIFLYILRVILGTNKREREGEEEETKWSNLCYFILYISIYNSHFALIFLTKNCIYNRHCLLHFLYPNFYCTFPHGESLFCSFSLLFLHLPLFSLWCKFSIFSYRKWSIREKRQRKFVQYNSVRAMLMKV